MLSSAVIVVVCHSIHAVCKKRAWTMFYGNSELPEFD